MEDLKSFSSKMRCFNCIIAAMSSCLHVSSIAPFSFLPATNRAGAIPILGTLVGAVRAVASLVILLFASIILCIRWIINGESKGMGDLCKISIIECGLGLVEIIPGLGTVAHILLDNHCYEEYLRF